MKPGSKLLLTSLIAIAVGFTSSAYANSVSKQPVCNAATVKIIMQNAVFAAANGSLPISTGAFLPPSTYVLYSTRKQTIPNERAEMELAFAYGILWRLSYDMRQNIPTTVLSNTQLLKELNATLPEGCK